MIRLFVIPVVAAAALFGMWCPAAATEFSQEGVRFEYDAALLGVPGFFREAARPRVSRRDRPERTHPAHRRVMFPNDRGMIWVFPTTDERVKKFASTYPQAQGAIGALRGILKERAVRLPPSAEIPWEEAGQPFRLKPQYLEFANGSGVAFLTQYSREASPPNNAELWYAFLGLTKNGAYYVNARFRVSHPALPNHPAPVQAGTDPFDLSGGRAAVEFSGGNALLEQQPDASFRPPLDQLRGTMRTIRVE